VSVSEVGGFFVVPAGGWESARLFTRQEPTDDPT
jgi:hypothetical protein